MYLKIIEFYYAKIAHCDLTNEGAIEIIDSLQNNSTLLYLDMSISKRKPYIK